MDKYQQLYRTFSKFYIDHKKNVLQEDKYQHLFYTLFEYYSNWKQILMHEYTYPTISHIFLDSRSSRE